MSDKNFFEEITPLKPARCGSLRTRRIKAMTFERIGHAEREEPIMEKKKILRPAFIGAAAVAVSAVSLVTVNAATGGGVVNLLQSFTATESDMLPPEGGVSLISPAFATIEENAADTESSADHISSDLEEAYKQADIIGERFNQEYPDAGIDYQEQIRALIDEIKDYVESYQGGELRVHLSDGGYIAVLTVTDEESDIKTNVFTYYIDKDGIVLSDSHAQTASEQPKRPENIVSSKVIVPGAEEMEIDLNNTGSGATGDIETFIPTEYAGYEVYAAEGGTVVYASWLYDSTRYSAEVAHGYGIVVCLELSNGEYAMYTHLANITDLFVGDKVEAGQQIGHVGDRAFLDYGVGYIRTNEKLVPDMRPAKVVSTQVIVPGAYSHIDKIDLVNTGGISYDIYGVTFIPADEGKEVHAAEGGTVEFVGFSDVRYGNSVSIRLEEGDYAVYCHLSEFADISVGDTVEDGKLIGYTGSTGYTHNEGVGYARRDRGLSKEVSDLTHAEPKREINIVSSKLIVPSAPEMAIDLNNTGGKYYGDKTTFIPAYPDFYDAEVLAAQGGEVVFADWYQGFGWAVCIKLGEDDYAVYCHLDDIAVSEGDTVTDGQFIGHAGSSGMIGEIGVGYARMDYPIGTAE